LFCDESKEVIEFEYEKHNSILENAKSQYLKNIISKDDRKILEELIDFTSFYGKQMKLINEEKDTKFKKIKNFFE